MATRQLAVAQLGGTTVLHTDLLGHRVEIPVHYDLWMRGARFGLVTSFRRGKPGQSDYVTVKMDHPQVRRCLKLWRLDWDYAKVLN
jgi:hypothetical protein